MHPEVEKAFAAAQARPSDINEHLETLRDYARQCSHVTEFGVRGGVSTTALIAAHPQKLRCYDIRREPTVARRLGELAIAEGIDFAFLEQDVRQADIEPTDLLFIDTWHTYDQLRAELRRHASQVRKTILLHDTVTFGASGEGGGRGLWPAIAEFLQDHAEWRIQEVKVNNNGLTVLTRIGGEVSPSSGESKQPIIHFNSPWSSRKQIADAYNSFMAILPRDEDFACFTDGDTMFTTVGFGRQLEEIVAAHPQCGLFYAVTNRIWCPWQKAPGVDPANHDMIYHREFGQNLAALHGSRTELISHHLPASGFLILVQKRLWLKVGGFRGNGMLRVDNFLYEDVLRAGEEIRLMPGVYLYHWYREGNNTVAHLQ